MLRSCCSKSRTAISQEVTNVAFVEGVRCPSFHIQFLDCFECMSSTLHFRILLSVNTLCTLMHSKYVFRTEVCNLEHSICLLITVVPMVKHKQDDDGPSSEFSNSKIHFHNTFRVLLCSHCSKYLLTTAPHILSLPLKTHGHTMQSFTSAHSHFTTSQHIPNFSHVQ